MNENALLVLASSSPRRRQLLALSGWIFNVQPADVDESVKPEEVPSEYVLRMAVTKAGSCAEHARREHIIVAADTAVVDGRDILGKPKNMAEAAGMLTRLRGHTHQVYTGIAVLKVQNGRMLTDLCVTDVPMRKYNTSEIKTYVATGDPLDKAGGYAIQHSSFNPVASLTGCYASVMGLPLCHLARLLGKIGIPSISNVPSNCQSALNYQCSIFQSVQRGEKIG